MVHFLLLLAAVQFIHSLTWLIPVLGAVACIALSLLVWRAGSCGRDQVLGSSAAIDALPNSVVVCDSDLQIQACNEGAERATGRVESELIGQPLEVLLQSANDLVVSATKMMAPHGSLPMTGIDANGESIDLDVTWALYSQGLDHRYVIVMTPLRERRRSQRIYQSLLEGTVLIAGEDFFPNLCQRMPKRFKPQSRLSASSITTTQIR